MNFNECVKFSEYAREIDDSLAVTIKVDWRVALQIVVDELTKKYKHNVGRNEEWAEAFEKVLSYYLDEQEMAHLTTHVADVWQREPDCHSNCKDGLHSIHCVHAPHAANE